jgi:hypothetical protein
VLQDHVTPLPLALVAAAHGACLLALIAVLRAPTARFPGWRVVRPGVTHWFCFVGCWAFAMLVSWVWLYVGSARRDAEAQMRWALLLILAFGMGAAWSGFYIAQVRRRLLRWRGATIRWRERGRDMVQDMADFNGFRRTFSGLFHVRFRDGAVLKLDLYCRNAEDLAATTSEYLGRDIDMF